MKPEKDDLIVEIVKEYLKNRYSAKTEEEIQRWLIEDENSAVKEEASLEHWNTLESIHNSETFKALRRVEVKSGILKKFPLHRRLMRIAAILIPSLLILSGIYYFTPKEKMIQVVAKYGTTEQIVLPDNSKVWLNAGSTISYPEKFGKSNRLVTLEGEAYFSVQKDTANPFVVNTKNLSVKVLGTEFNVRAYKEDIRTITTLATGKVEIKTTSGQARILQPNEQLTLNNQTSDINIERIPAEDASSWKSGQLIFADATLGEILQTLERRFDVSFETNRPDYKSGNSYTIRFLKNEGIEQILDILKDIAGDFSYKIEGNKIIITSK